MNIHLHTRRLRNLKAFQSLRSVCFLMQGVRGMLALIQVLNFTLLYSFICLAASFNYHDLHASGIYDK